LKNRNLLAETLFQSNSSLILSLKLANNRTILLSLKVKSWQITDNSAVI